MATNVIGRVVFELDTQDQVQARAAQERVSRFAAAGLARALDAALQTVPAQGAPLRIPGIVLDLGELYLDQIERELGARIETALREHLRGMAGWRHGAARLQVAPDGPLDAFAAWLDGGPGAGLEAVLAAALALPDAAGALLRERGRRQEVRRRLARLRAPLAAAIVRCVEPEHAAPVLAVVSEVTQAHARRPLVPASQADLTAAVWEFVFAYLLLERGSYFETRALSAHVLAGIAGRYRIGYRALLETLTRAAAHPGLPQTRGPSLPALLQDLHRDLPPLAGQRQEAPRPLHALAHVLRYGIPAPAAADGVQLGLGALLDDAIEERPDALRTLLRTLAASGTVCERLAAQAGEARLRALVRVLERAHAEPVLHAVDAARAAQARQRLAVEDGRRFGHRLWSFVLQVLLAERGSHFNLRAFVKRLVEGMAVATGSAYADWLEALDVCTSAAPGGMRRARLVRVLAELRAEREEAAPGPAPAAAGALARAMREFGLRTRAIARGSRFNERSYVDDLLRKLALRHGVGYGRLLGALAARTGARAAGSGSLPAILCSLRDAEDAVAARTDTGWAFLLAGRAGAGPGWARVLAAGPRLGPRPAVLAALRADRGGALAARLADYLPADERERLLGWLAPDLAGALARVLEAGGGAAAHWRAMLAVLARHDGGCLQALLAAYAERVEPAAPARVWHRIRRVAAARGGAACDLVLLDLCERQLRHLGAPAWTATNREGAMTGATPPRPAWPAAASPATLAQALARVLREGLHGWRTAWHGAPDWPTLCVALAPALAMHPHVFRPALRAACARPLERERIARLLPAPLRDHAVAALLGPAPEKFLWWRDVLAGGLAARAPRATAAWSDVVDAELLRLLAQRRRPDLDAWLTALGAVARRDAGLAWPELLGAWRARADRSDEARRRPALRLLERMARRPVPGAAGAAEPAAPARQAPPPAAAAPEPAAQDTPIDVGNAGIVLLWPFFGHLFDSLGLTVGGQFRGEAERMRAVYLLDHLAWDRWDAPEEELALAKLLCGMALETPLLPCAVATGAERELCASLLAAAIEHWGRLGSTDGHGLRQTFLQRAGALRPRDGHWHLHVPEETFDILITTLPWSLATVRLSWMKHILWVTWK